MQRAVVQALICMMWPSRPLGVVVHYSKIICRRWAVESGRTWFHSRRATNAVELPSYRITTSSKARVVPHKRSRRLTPSTYAMSLVSGIWIELQLSWRLCVG